MNTSIATQSRPGGHRLQTFYGYAALLGLVGLMFGDVLGQGGTQLLGSRYGDLYQQLIAWRQFGFEALRAGHIPLWNPHVFGGAPYVGGFQSALFYPPNWLFLILPLPIAINWSIALHVFLMGAFVNLWGLRRGLHPLAAFLAGALMMLSGPYFLHIYAGHLTNLCAMVWAPLVFLAIDEVIALSSAAADYAKRAVRWCLFGTMVVAWQILAGHPQYVFYTSVAAVLYGGLRLRGSQHRVRGLACLAVIALGALPLAAIQLLPSWQAASEVVRGQALSFQFASMMSFPPENFITWIAPHFFGGLSVAEFYGRSYLWEGALFLGVTGLFLAVWEIVCRVRRVPGQAHHAMQQLPAAAWGIMVGVLLLLALGANTPLFELLYAVVPGFDRFRGLSKFIFPATLFGCMLAGAGLDRLLVARRVGTATVLAVLAAGALCWLAAWVIRGVHWLPVLQAIGQTQESDLWNAQMQQADFGARQLVLADLAKAAASEAMGWAGSTLLLLGGLLALLRKWSRAVWAVAGLAVLEVFVFAAHSRETFAMDDPVTAQSKAFLGARPGDYRIANTLNGNNAMRMGAHDLGGNDPGVVRRYAELMGYLQTGSADNANQYLDFLQDHPLYAMFRLRFVFQPEGVSQIRVSENRNPMPHVALIGQHRVVQGRDAVLRALTAPEFNPREEVILESPPNPAPQAQPNGGAQIVRQSSDSLTIVVDTDRPAVLLITDVYTPSWRATAIAGSAQQHYELMPANYALRAIPLTAGRHGLVVEYNPGYFQVGALISALSLVLWFCVLLWLVRTGRRSAG